MVSIMDTTYWKQAWKPREVDSDYAIITCKQAEGFFISHNRSYDGKDPDDIGPFSTFEAAAACFETLVGV
jgi:hypothetical protein